MDYFLTYLILRLDYFSFVAAILAIAVAVVFVVLAVIYLSNDVNNTIEKNTLDKIKPWLKPVIIIFCIAVFLNVIVPNTKQAAVVYCLPKIVNNEQAQKLPDNLLRLANQWIDGQVNKTVETAEMVVETVTEVVEN